MSEPNPIQPPPAEDASSQALAGALRSSFFIVKIIMAVLVVCFLGSGFFIVHPQEKAIILRLGKPVGQGEKILLGPGWHFAFPSPIDEIQRVQFTSIQEADSSVGWMQSPADRKAGVAPPMMGNSLDPASVSYALTADTNILHVFAVMRYQITDPAKYLFNFTDAAVFVTNVLNNALLYTTSQFPVDDILTRRKQPFREAVTRRVEDLIHSQDLGIKLIQLDVDASPPITLAAKFNEVDAATQKSATVLRQAQSYEATKLAQSRGTADAKIYEAETARARMVEMIQAEANEFATNRALFDKDPTFFKRVRQMTAMEEIYNNAQEKILEPHEGSRELRLNLSRENKGAYTNSVPQ